MIKIEKVTIKGFKRIEQAEADLSPHTNLFLGHNETGKTSLQDAIIYALTDEIHGQAKKNFAEIINDRGKTASITVTGTTGSKAFTIRRTLSKTSRTGPSPIQIGAQLNVEPDILSACLNANYYFELSADQQKKLLTKTLGLNPTEQEAADILAEKGHASDLNTEIIQEIGASGWDDGYKLAYTLRREAGQTTKVLLDNQPQLITQVNMGNQKVSIDTIMETDKKKPLAEQKKKHEASLKKLYEELGGIQALSKAEKDKTEEKLRDCQEDLADLAKQEKWTQADTAQTSQIKKAKAKFDTEKTKNIIVLQELKNSSELLLAENKQNWKSNLVCPVAEQSGHKMCPAIEPNWSEQKKEIEKLTERVRAAKEKKFSGQDQWDNLSEKATECKDNLALSKSLEKDILEFKETLKNAQPEAMKRKEDIEIAIEQIVQKLENLKIAQTAITWNQATQKTSAATQIRVQEAKAHREHYDILCDLLKPDGIPGELIAQKLGPLNARLAKHAGMIGQSVQFLDDLSLVYGNKKQLWVLGGAEQARVRMAIAEAISHVTKVGLLLMDEVNVSVAQDSTRVQSWMLRVGKDTQILAAAATNSETAPAAPKNSPVRIFWVENGEIAQTGEEKLPGKVN